MDTKPNNTSEYFKTKVLTAQPEELQLMLYDGAIRFCEQAVEALGKRELEKSYHLITRAEDIILELHNSIKVDVAPDTCKNMQALYIFCYERLVTANLKRDVNSIDEALKVLRHIRETWLMLMEKLKEEKGVKQPNQQPTEADLSQPRPANDDILAETAGIGGSLNMEG